MNKEGTALQEIFHKFPHGVIVLKGNEIVHAVGYPKAATQEDVDSLVKELASDPDLGLIHLRDYDIVPLSGKEWQRYMRLFAGDK